MPSLLLGPINTVFITASLFVSLLHTDSSYHLQVLTLSLYLMFTYLFKVCVYTGVHEVEALYTILNYPQIKISQLIIIFYSRF